MFALLLLAVLPRPDGCIKESVDLMELNHLYDDNGRFVNDQIIFYEWSDLFGRYDVRAWRWAKTPRHCPEFDWETGCWRVLFNDDRLRYVTSPSFRETWTQYDPELTEREILPKEMRRELKMK